MLTVRWSGLEEEGTDWLYLATDLGQGWIPCRLVGSIEGQVSTIAMRVSDCAISCHHAD
jgi:hypothetical protein